jgi:hypothetical protein
MFQSHDFGHRQNFMMPGNKKMLIGLTRLSDRTASLIPSAKSTEKSAGIQSKSPEQPLALFESDLDRAVQKRI